MDYNESIKKVAGYIGQFYTKQADRKIVYHNSKHTWELIDTVNRISSDYSLDDRSRFIMLTAAWFYDTGYFIPGTENHKTKSATCAAEFLKTIGCSEEDIQAVQDCITATKLPQEPKNLNEEIVCDAVMYYLGTKGYAEKSKLLRKETETLHGITISGKDWRERSIALMESHHYFTDYCRENLTPVKIENLNRIKRKQEEKTLPKVVSDIAPAVTQKLNPVIQMDTGTIAIKQDGDNPVEETNTPKKNKEKKKNRRPVRGVDSVFRISATNHQRLSAMADNKAHIMISVNSIVISVLLGLIARKLDKYQDILIPTILMLTTNVTAIIFSVLATRPRIPKGYFTKEQVKNKDIDLTFFGNFYRMDFPDYEAGMKDMMKDSEFAYGSLIRNVYGQGKVLGKKFTYLRISYNVFMIGMTIAVIAFVIVFAFAK
ncbi:MAG: phosphohydrolase [Bacteroidetes bacterium]|nr:phosphohydrolase [Bacteroidota bacterium]